MLNPPVGVTVADYVAASLAQNESHVRITFLAQNVVLEDEDIESSGITISSVLNGDTNLSIGKAVSKELKIPILNSSKVAGLIWTSNLKVEYGLMLGGSVKWVTVGYFIGTRPERFMTEEVIDFTAMDYMQKFDVLADDWLKTLTYPMTVLQMLKSLCAYCGVGWTSGDELANIKNRSFDSAPIQQSGLLCRDILGVIAEACGCYARINADGNCQLVWFENHTGDYALTGDDEFSPVVVQEHTDGRRWIDLEDYTWADLENLTWADLGGTINQYRIDAVNVKFTEDDIGVYYPSATNGNIYYIVDNPFLMTANQTDVVNYIVPIYTRLNNFNGYLPSNLSAVGCALIESGDVINIEANGETVRMPIFVKTMQWNGSLTDTMECTGDPISMRSIPQGIRERLSEGGRYHIYKNTVDELYSELYDPSTGDVSVLKQIASGLGMSANQIDLQAGKKLLLESGANIEVKSGGELKVESGGDIDINASGSFSLQADTFDVESTNFKVDSTNKIFRAGDWILASSGLRANFKIGFDSRMFEMEPGTNEEGNHYGVKFASHENTTGEYGYFIVSNGMTPDINIIPAEDKSGSIGYGGSRWQAIYASYINYETLSQYSSKNIKHDIQLMPSVGDELDKLEPVIFVYDDDKDEKVRYGLIYEDTVEVMPEICTDDESNKAINYMELIPMLLKEIQDLRARVKALEEREEQ